MKKVAIFVEGFTEQQFVIKLIRSIAGKRGVTFEIQEQFCGLLQLVEMRQVEGAEFFVLMVNCNNDAQVKSQVISQHAALTRNGYSKIIGLRDVFPHGHDQLHKVREFLAVGLPEQGAPIEIVLAILEVEAWFIDEHTHYERIDASMTLESIVAKGHDIESTRGDAWPQPAIKLHEIYSEWGLAYKKKTNQINRTVNALSDEELYVTVRGKSPSLDVLICSLEEFLFAEIEEVQYQ